MRDIFVTLVVFGFLPMCFSRPDRGLLLFSWISTMNAHRLCWGFATSLPFAQATALVTIIGLLISKEPKKIPWTVTNITLAIFILWMFITTCFAFNELGAWVKWNVVWKIQLMAFLIMMIMTTKERIDNLIWVVALSLAFYGVKGGLFTVLTGGGYRVWGPPGTFIGGNNEIGLALNMTIPLLRYLQLRAENVWVKWGLTGAIVLTIICIFGTQSRGALVGLAAMLLFLIAKSRKKALLILVLVISVPPVVSFMPDSWHERMHTVKTYQTDGSAMGRINAWRTAINIAEHRVLGCGFKCLISPEIFALYAPNPDDVHDAHSIYFEVLAEHGLIGLILFLIIGVSAWFTASKAIKLAKKRPDSKWIVDLCSMIQVSFVGYAISGMFLGLATFDLYYTLIAVVICTYNHIKNADPVAVVDTRATDAATVTRRRDTAFVKPPIGKAGSALNPKGRFGRVTER